MTTTRAIQQRLDALLAELLDAGLVLEVNGLGTTARRVTWVPRESATPFLGYRQHATVEQYLHWLTTRAYCAVLLDGSLLQITYDIENGRVSGHRLAYIPCPYDLDLTLIEEGFSIEDLVELYDASPTEPVALRSHIRFDYDPAAAKPGHPASHMTINSVNCRIACVAPMHMTRFIDFVFRHFYPNQHQDNPALFENCGSHVGANEITDEDREGPHFTWANTKPLRQ